MVMRSQLFPPPPLTADPILPKMPRLPRPRAMIGQTVSHYRIVERIGGGSILLAPDAKTCVFGYHRMLADLYLVEGLKYTGRGKWWTLRRLAAVRF